MKTTHKSEYFIVQRHRDEWTPMENMDDFDTFSLPAAVRKLAKYRRRYPDLRFAISEHITTTKEKRRLIK